MFDSPDLGIKKYRFIESSYCNNDSRFIENWKSDLQGSIVELLKRFRARKGWCSIGKLFSGLDMTAIKKNVFTLEDIAGIHVPVQAAAKSLELIN